MGQLRCGQGAGEGQGAAAFANLQARADLMAAVNGAKDSDVPLELIEAAQGVLVELDPKPPAPAPVATKLEVEVGEEEEEEGQLESPSQVRSPSRRGSATDMV